MILGRLTSWIYTDPVLPNSQPISLVIESKPDCHFLRAHCSACPDVRFNLLGNTLAEKMLLRSMFEIHVRQVHRDKHSEIENSEL